MASKIGFNRGVLSIQQGCSEHDERSSDVVAIVLSRTSMASLGLLTDAFGHMSQAFETDAVIRNFTSQTTRLRLISPAGAREVTLSGGGRIATDPWSADIDRVRMIYLPSFRVQTPEAPHEITAETERLDGLLCQLAGRGVPIAAHGAGVLHVVRAGLLDGLEASVPAGLEAFVRRSRPQVRLVPHTGVVASGRILTLGGAQQGAELMLALFRMAVSDVTARGIELRSDDLRGADRMVVAAERWIVEHASETFRIGDLAERYNLTHQTFTRRFREQTGRTPSDYVLFYRMKRGAVLLTSTSLPVNEIAALCGYSDVPAFRAQFRKAFGCSPVEFRRRPEFPDQS